MSIPTHAPAANADHLQQWLSQFLPAPKYTYTKRAGILVVGTGLATGVMVKSAGPGQVKLGWEMPNLGIKLLMVLSIPLTGILPGLVLWGIMWAAISGGVDNLKKELTHVLQTGTPPPGAMGGQPGMMGGQPGMHAMQQPMGQQPMGAPMGQQPMGAPMGQQPMGQQPMGAPMGQQPMGQQPMGQPPMGQQQPAGAVPPPAQPGVAGGGTVMMGVFPEGGGEPPAGG